MLGRANSAVDKELRSEALQELIVRVDDWKQHQVDQFGELLLHGQFTVVTGKSDVEKEVRNPHALFPPLKPDDVKFPQSPTVDWLDFATQLITSELQ